MDPPLLPMVNGPVIILQDQLRGGGTERQSLLLAKALREKGWDARLLLFSPGGRLASQPEREQIPVDILQPFNLRLPLWAPGLAGNLRGRQPRALICMGRTTNCYAGSLQKKFPDVAVIGNLRTGKSVLPWQRRSWQKVRAVFVNCNWWKDELVRAGLDSGRIFVHPNPLAIRVPPDAERLIIRRRIRQQMQVDEQTPVAVQMAGFRSGKRHRLLLKWLGNLANQNPDTFWKLWLPGEGPELRSCRRFVRRHQLENRVCFPGYLDDPAPIYAAADLAFSCSVEDALPNFLLEAQAFGLPVLATNYRGVRECFVPGKSGFLVAAEDEKRFTENAFRLLTDQGLRQSMGVEAKEFARLRFDPVHRMKLWIEDLERVIENTELRG